MTCCEVFTKVDNLVNKNSLKLDYTKKFLTCISIHHKFIKFNVYVGLVLLPILLHRLEDLVCLFMLWVQSPYYCWFLPFFWWRILVGFLSAYLHNLVYSTCLSDCKPQSLSWKMIRILATNFKIILLGDVYDVKHHTIHFCFFNSACKCFLNGCNCFPFSYVSTISVPKCESIRVFACVHACMCVSMCVCNVSMSVLWVHIVICNYNYVNMYNNT